MDSPRPLFSLCPRVFYRLGKFCNCSASDSAAESSMCVGPGMKEACSGRGDCECGACVCHNPEQFEGPFCQFDKTQCQRYAGFLCNGTALYTYVRWNKVSVSFCLPSRTGLNTPLTLCCSLFPVSPRLLRHGSVCVRRRLDRQRL